MVVATVVAVIADRRRVAVRGTLSVVVVASPRRRQAVVEPEMVPVGLVLWAHRSTFDLLSDQFVVASARWATIDRSGASAFVVAAVAVVACLTARSLM